VLRHHERLSRLPIEGDSVLLTKGKGGADGFDETWRVVPPFGPFPRALSESYPLTAEVPDRLDDRAYVRAAEGVVRLAAENPDTAFALVAGGWPETALAALPDRVRVLGRNGSSEDAAETADEREE